MGMQRKKKYNYNKQRTEILLSKKHDKQITILDTNKIDNQMSQNSLKLIRELNINSKSKNDIISQISPSIKEDYSITPKKIINIKNSIKQSDSKIETISLNSSKNLFQNNMKELAQSTNFSKRINYKLQEQQNNNFPYNQSN